MPIRGRYLGTLNSGLFRLTKQRLELVALRLKLAPAALIVGRLTVEGNRAGHGDLLGVLEQELRAASRFGFVTRDRRRVCRRS